MKTFAQFIKLEEARSGVGGSDGGLGGVKLPFKAPPKLDVHKSFGLKKPPKPKKMMKKPGKPGMMKPKKMKSLFPVPKRVPSLPNLAIKAATHVVKHVFS